MRKTALIAVSLALVAGLAHAQAPPESLFLVDFKAKPLAVVNKPWYQLTEVFGTKQSVTLGTFAGAGIGGNVTAGASALTSWKLAKEADLVFGFAYRISTETSNIGFIIGVRLLD